MTKAATASEYITIPVATVVGGTLKLLTMPLSATGSEATLKDISAWPKAIAIIGAQDPRISVSALVIAPVLVVMAFILQW
jgi:hypothetical protein